MTTLTTEHLTGGNDRPAASEEPQWAEVFVAEHLLVGIARPVSQCYLTFLVNPSWL